MSTGFTVEQHQKELGIRKVLGAPGFSLFGLLSKELFLLVILSMAFASPLAWYIMTSWLQSMIQSLDDSLEKIVSTSGRELCRWQYMTFSRRI